jgi:3-oxosteroid 1-dehydrogenase
VAQVRIDPRARAFLVSLDAMLATNDRGQVLDQDDSPIASLHAVGKAAARLDTGGSYNSGIANTRGLAFGHLSARHLLG